MFDVLLLRAVGSFAIFMWVNMNDVEPMIHTSGGENAWRLSRGDICCIEVGIKSDLSLELRVIRVNRARLSCYPLFPGPSGLFTFQVQVNNHGNGGCGRIKAGNSGWDISS